MRAWKIILALCLAPLARADQATDIAQIHLEAIGGRKRIEALRALRMSGQVVVGERKLRFTMIAARPDRVRLETESNGRTLVNASDGVEPPWEFDTGNWPPRYRDMDAGAARGFTADAEFDDPLIAGPARGFTLDYAGVAEIDGKKYLRMLVTKDLKTSFSLLLDEETYFIVMRVEERTTAAGRKRNIVTRYDDFRPVDGVLLPHRVTLLTDGRIEQRMAMERIETNPEITAETFTRPKPVVPPKESP